MNYSFPTYFIPLGNEVQKQKTTLLTGACHQTPYTEKEALELLGQIGGYAKKCDECFDEEGNAFWHIGQIKYGTSFVPVALPPVAVD